MSRQFGIRLLAGLWDAWFAIPDRKTEEGFKMLLPRLCIAAFLGLSFALSGQIAATQTGPEPGAEAADARIADAAVAELTEAMHLDDLFVILREEGLSYGQSLEADMFPGSGGAQWTAAVSSVYDLPTLRRDFETALGTALAGSPEVVAGMVDFFRTDLGQRVVRLEIEARHAFLDEATEEAARVAADDRFANRDPKVPLLRSFIAAGDLVEMNVAGSLSGNLAFMTGMSDSGVYGQGLPQDQMLSDIWAQEDQIRDDTTSWLYAYLGLAYEPLTEAELQAYVDFMETPAGQRLNAALFAAFENVFRKVSYDLGRAAGVAMTGQDI
jgi:hypothetical protein